MSIYNAEAMIASGNPRYMEGGNPTIWIQEAKDGFVTYNPETDKMSMLGASKADRAAVAKYKNVGGH